MSTTASTNLGNEEASNLLPTNINSSGGGDGQEISLVGRLVEVQQTLAEIRHHVFTVAEKKQFKAKQLELWPQVLFRLSTLSFLFYMFIYFLVIFLFFHYDWYQTRRWPLYPSWDYCCIVPNVFLYSSYHQQMCFHYLDLSFDSWVPLKFPPFNQTTFISSYPSCFVVGEIITGKVAADNRVLPDQLPFFADLLSHSFFQHSQSQSVTSIKAQTEIQTKSLLIFFFLLYINMSLSTNSKMSQWVKQ